MSIKSDVLEHLMTHPNEVVSLTALASTLDVTLDQVRVAVSSLRTGGTKGNDTDIVKMHDQIHIVSRGYAVKFCPPVKPTSKSTPTPADMPKHVAEKTPIEIKIESAPTTTTDEPSTVDGKSKGRTVTAPLHPYTDDLEEVLGQLGPVAHKVFAFIASQNGQNVHVMDIVDGTGLSRSAVTSTCYNTLYNRKQLNRNAARMFIKVGIDVYRHSMPGDGVKIDGPGQRNSKFPAKLPVVPATFTSDPVVTKTVAKLYGDKATGLSTQKRIFEEIRTLPDGAVLIEDEDGNVYKAREI